MADLPYIYTAVILLRHKFGQNLPQLMRLLKFAGVFIIVAGILLGFILYVNWDAFRTVYVNRESIAEGSEWVPKTYSVDGLLEYIRLHPEQVSIVSYTVENPDKGIFYGADIPRVYGSSGIALLMAEMYRQAEAGLLNLNDTVPVENISRFVINGIEESSFTNAVRDAEKAGYITGDRQIRLDDLFYLNLVKGNLHVYDYVLVKLGRENLAELIAETGFGIENPFPFTGLYLMSVGGLFNRSQEEQLQYLESLDRSSLAGQAWQLTTRYLEDETFRAEVKKFTERRGLNLSFIQMRRLFNLLPRATPRKLAQLMQLVYNQSLINPDISGQVLDKLRWPENRAIVRNTMDVYAAAYDNRMSMLNGVDTGRRTGSETASVQVVMFQDLPVSMWMHMSSNFINQELQRMLISDPAFFDKAASLTD
jgi:hypothetical protein